MHKKNKALRIDFLIDSMVVGGTQRHLVMLLPALQKSGYDVRLWCRRGDGEYRYALKAAGVPVMSGRGVWYAFLRACLMRQVKCVHTFMMRDSLWEVVAARVSGAVVIRSARNAGHWRTGGSVERLKVALRRRLVHFFHANSSVVRDYLKEGEKVPGDRITVIENATVDMRDALPRLSRDGIGLRESDFVIVALERLTGRKNTLFLIDALARLRAEHGKDICLLVVGDGGCRGALMTRADELGLGSDACVFTGSSTISHAYLREGDVFVNASKAGSEGFSNSLLEAVMMGKPCVVSEGNRCGVVREGENGTYFDPESPDGLDEFCEIIAGLQADPERLAAMGVASREIFKAEYTLERQTSSYTGFYEIISGDSIDEAGK